MPAFTIVPPVYVFCAVIAMVPAPSFTTPPLPSPELLVWITPLISRSTPKLMLPMAFPALGTYTDRASTNPLVKLPPALPPRPYHSPDLKMLIPPLLPPTGQPPPPPPPPPPSGPPGPTEFSPVGLLPVRRLPVSPGRPAGCKPAPPPPPAPPATATILVTPLRTRTRVAAPPPPPPAPEEPELPAFPPEPPPRSPLGYPPSLPPPPAPHPEAPLAPVPPAEPR